MSSTRRDRPPRISKGGTVTLKKHRFESFNQRIAKLKVDPVQRARRQDVDKDNLSSTTSFFKVGLASWGDLNLSENFAAFLREAEPLCDSLPQILHYQQRIMDILVKYIERKDVLSLEPLLSLMGHLAHDLGARFAIHFSRAVVLITSLAAKHVDVEVIEWSFACLAWLFKYLSRLLVPDLRPVYNIMAPLLGKESQKIHITKFAAGAMSFLLRKAALGHQKNTEPLTTVVRHILSDVEALGDQNVELYRYGIMTLFADAIKGIHRGLHSGGSTIYQCLLDQVTTPDIVSSPTCANIVNGVTINLIHHTDVDSFIPVLDVIHNDISRLSKSSNSPSISLYGELLFIVATVRKGSRIGDWKPMVDSLMSLLEQSTIEDKPLSAAYWQSVFEVAAVVFQYSPLDLVIPKFSPAMAIITNESNRRSFVPFCIYFSQLGRDRFQSLLAPHFFKFVIQNWREEELQICSSIPVLLNHDSPDNHPMRPTIACPHAWQQQIIDTFEKARIDDNLLVQCGAYLDMLRYMSVDNTTTGHLKRILDDVINECLSLSTSTSQRLSFSLGVAFESLLRLGNMDTSRCRQLWPLLCAMSDRFGSMPLYLENLILLCENYEVDLHDTSTNILISSLVRNLSCSVHTLRSLSLRLLCALYAKAYRRDSDALQTALLIENTPLNLQSARSASMHVRELLAQHNAILSDPWLSKAIPYFCFGLLTFKLSQLWDDAVDILKGICESKTGEDIVSEIAFQWLEDGLSTVGEAASFKSEAPRPQHLNEFQCSEFSRVKGLIERSFQDIIMADEQLRVKHNAKHRLDCLKIPEVASRALRVLLGIPHIAEKRSRRLVPIFLQWASLEQTKETTMSAQADDEDLVLEMTAQDEQMKQDKLGLKDRRAMLDLFSRFANPRVLFRSSEVYQALLDLLTNGSVELQKSALKAIFTWKNESIQPYQENLFNLLDDSRFREEISGFLQVDPQESTIEDPHRLDLMPVLLRLLYGKIIARSGSASGRRGQVAKRRAVFEALSRFSNDNLKEFVRICVGPLGNLTLSENTFKVEDMCSGQLTVRKQVGLVNMMNDMLETLGSRLAFLGQPIANAVMYCLTQSSQDRALGSDGGGLASSGSAQVSLLKDIRQVGLHCLTLLFQNCPARELQPYLLAVFTYVLNPRLENLPIETAQSVSGMLQLFSVWASSPEMCFYLTRYNVSLMGAVIDCLEVPSAKDEVKLFVIDRILKQLITLVNRTESRELDIQIDRQLIQTEVLKPHVDHILAQAGSLLRKSPSKELLGAMISLVSQLAPTVTGASQIENLLEVSAFLLDQPAQRVNPKSKGDLLRIIQHFVPLLGQGNNEALQQHLYDSVSSLFGYFKDRSNRVILSEVLSTLAQRDTDLLRVADLCIALNSFSSRSIDEPDFEKRLMAFNSINEVEYTSFSTKEWKPLVYNMLFYIKDNEELAIRSNASFALRRFVETTPMMCTTTNTSADNLLKQVLLPSLRNGASERSELVRTEYLAIMAHIIRVNPGWSEISDMVVLLVNDDEEASFFGNILHIQQHRRLRALRRLATEARQGHLRSANIAHFLIPLIEHFIFDKADDESSHNLTAEAILTIGALADWLEWPQLRAMFRRFSGYVQSKPDLEKTTIKLLGIVVDALGNAGIARQQHVSLTSAQGTDHGTDASSVAPETQPRSTLCMTLPSIDKLTDDLTRNLLPPLVSYLHEKDESTVSLRVPVAISVVKLLKLLPSERLAERLPPMLTDVCHILRSRGQESRDMTRKTLVEISILVGPLYFGFILKELRGSLARGYQLHVLSYTVHSILVATAPLFKPGDLDYCLPQIVSVIMDDIFGATGQEKDAEEYISKMKEIKSSKSYDSMELIAKTATITHLSSLVKPLQTLMGEKLDLRMVKKIDELLRRIGVGLLRNDSVQSREVLMFCFEIIKNASRHITGQEKKSKEDYRVKRFLLSSKGSNAKRGSSSTYEYKLARFALDILRSVLHKFDALQTPSNLSGFIPVIEDALLQSQEEVQTSALRLLATIIKVPLKVIDENGVKYVSEAVKIIKETTSSNTEIAQAALKLVSAMLRERQNVGVKESDIAYLLKRLQPDLDEPDRQGVTFNFLKAVMARKIIIPEIYETLDTVAAMMVTNQTQGTRDLARGVYFQFVINYPQSKDRLVKQLSFLVKNLNYKYIEGRQSVMEAVHLLLSKVGDDLIQELVGTFFVPLMMVIANDDSADCRRMAGELLKELFVRADNERIKQVLSMLKTWLNQDENNLLTRISLQVYGIYLDVQGVKGETEALLLRERITYILKRNLSDTDSADWEVLYFALLTAAKLCQTFHTTMFKSKSAPLWSEVRECLYFPHAWVKLAAAQLLGIYFADFARINAGTEQSERLLRGSGGLRLGDEEMMKVTKASFRSLRIPGMSEELATQCVRNLIFLGRFIGTAKMVRSNPKVQALNGASSDKEDEDEGHSELESDDRSDKSALQYMFERVSAILRREPLNTRAPSLVPKTASLQIMAALCSHLPLSTLVPLTEIILLPLHNLTDPSIAAPYSSDEGFRTAYKALVSSSQEIMSLLQQKLGTTEYIMRLTKVKEGVKGRREGRRAKRRIEAVSQPEKMGRDKKRKGEKKKEKRKERSGEERGRRRGW